MVSFPCLVRSVSGLGEALHFVTVSGRLEPQHPVRPGQGNPQASHPRGRDRKRPARCLGIKTEIELKLMARPDRDFVADLIREERDLALAAAAARAAELALACG